jgi:glycosyltransferase involved in cell wall biosynthesis
MRMAGLEHWRIMSRFRQTFTPKLGVLYHYPPIDINIPQYYTNSRRSKPELTISIVTPSYNHGEFIERTIASVLDQYYEELEYIIQDGGSSDHTVEILRSYGKSLTHWESRIDAGQANAIQLGFDRTTGDIMAYLNSDDMLMPGALHYIAEYFNRHPGADVVYGHRVLTDEADREIGRWVLPRHCDDVLSWADFIPQETLFWRREIWERAGGYIDQSLRFAMDWELILRFRELGARFVRLPRFLGMFRVHPQQKTCLEMEQIGQKEMKLLRKRYLKHEPSVEEINKNIRFYLLKHVLLDKAYRLKLLKY